MHKTLRSRKHVMQVTVSGIAVLGGLDVSQHDCVQTLLGSGQHDVTLDEAILPFLISSYGWNVDRQNFPLRLAFFDSRPAMQ